MRRWIGSLILTSGLVGMIACSAKKSNSDFPVTVEEMSGADYENPLWQKLLAVLQMDPLDGTSQATLESSLANPPEYILDATLATAATQARALELNSGAEAAVCDGVGSVLTDLNPGAAVSLSNGFKMENGQPKALTAPARVYWMQYRLKGDAADAYRHAILTVPTTSAATAFAASSGKLGVRTEAAGALGYPILLYAHAAASGLAYEEIAQTIGDLQSGFITASPVFPGETLCKQYDALNGKKIPSCSGDNILREGKGNSVPYQNDGTDLIGLYDCLKTLNAGGVKQVVDATGNTAASENIQTKTVKIQATAQTAFLSQSLTTFAEAAGSPLAVIAGVGRGAAAAGLALVRAGALNSVLLSSAPQQDALTLLAGKGAKPALFSCALLVSPQASFTAGVNKLFLDYWVRNQSGILTSTQIQALSLIPGFPTISAKIAGIRDNPLSSDDAKAEEIATYLKSIDLTLQQPLLHGGLQNFGKQFTAAVLKASNATASAATAAAAQGSALVLHGSMDKVADVGNSVLLTEIGSQTSQNLLAQGIAPGVTWTGIPIVPPQNLLEDGELMAGDNGHVVDPSFLYGHGEEGILSSSPSVVTAPYAGLSVSTVIATWLAGSCAGSFNSAAVN